MKRRALLAGAGAVAVSRAAEAATGAANLPPLSILDFGATGDGGTNDDAARSAGEAAATSAGCPLYWPAGSYVVSQTPSLTVSWGPGTVSVAGSQVYLRPTPEPAKSILVAVMSSISPSSGVSGTDVTTPLQALVNFAQSNNLPIEFQPFGSYYVQGGLSFKHGQSATDTQSYNTLIKGNNCALLPGPNVPAIAIVPRCLIADQGTGRGTAFIEINDLQINTYFANPASSGILIGADGYWCDSFIFSKIENVLFLANTTPGGSAYGAVALKVISSKHIQFNRFVCRGGTVLLAGTATNGGGVEDLVFDHCEMNGTAEYRPLAIVSTTDGVGGIRFEHCDFYRTGTLLNCAPTTSEVAHLANIWFDSCSWDGPGAPANEAAIQITLSGYGDLDQLHLNSAYIVNYQGPAIVVQRTGTTALMHEMRVVGASLNEISPTGAGSFPATVVWLQNVPQFEFIGTQMSQCGNVGTIAYSLFELDTCSDVILEATQENIAGTPPTTAVAISNCSNILVANNQFQISSSGSLVTQSGTNTGIIVSNTVTIAT